MRIFDFVFSFIFIINILYGSSLPNFNTSDKDKLLIEIISYVIDKGHYNPKEMNDDFSKNVFNSLTFGLFILTIILKSLFNISPVNNLRAFSYFST